MATIKVIFYCGWCFILLAYPSSGIDHGKQRQLLTIAWSQLGVKEATGHNDGLDVEKYLATVGLNKGQPWCAAFVAWCYQQAAIKNPNSGLAADYFRKNIVYENGHLISAKLIHAGDTFGIYFENLDGIHHVGFVLAWSDMWVETIEGNTNSDGSREGNEVCHKKRLRKQIYQVSSWIN